MSRALLGTVTEKDGSMALQTAPNCWYPLGGSSSIAFEFRQAFGRAQKHDAGKLVYRVGDVMQMENVEQRDKRLNEHNPDKNPNWTPKVAYRVYACDECSTETKISTNHTGGCFSNCAGKCRDIFNPHTAREVVQWHPMRRHHFVREAE